MPRRPLTLLLSLLALLIAGAPSATAGTTASAAKAQASATAAQKSCKRATAKAAKAKTVKQAKARRKAMKRACKKASKLSRVAPQAPGMTASGAAPNVAAPADAGPRVEPADGQLRTGIVGNFQGMGSGSFAALHSEAASTGAGWTREEILWSRVQPTAGTWNWSHYDDLFLSAARQGLRVLPQLDDTPDWAGANWNTVPADPTAFAAYTANVVARYGPGGTFWDAHREFADFAPTHFEIWNEAYYAPGGSDEYDPGRYARLVRAAAIAGRAANPAAKYLLGSEVTGRMQGSTWVHWTDALYQAVPDLNNYFDAVAVHPYGEDMTGLTDVGFGQFRRLERLRDKFAAHGASDKPFWITELGWATCTQSDECVTEAQQAANIRRAFEMVRGPYAGFVEAIFFYHYKDWGPEDQSNKEYWFGLNRRDGSPKPALTALRDETL